MSVDASFFVHDGEVTVLVDYIERDILSDEFHRLYFPLYLDRISAIDFFVLAETHSIARYLLFIYHLLDIAP